jgi:two-component system, NtrC family, sensor kinase
VCLSFIGVLTLLYHKNIFSLEEKLTTVEHFDDFLNNILELRRYEKNFIFTRDMESLHETIFYLFSVEDALKRLRESIKRVVDQEGYESLGKEVHGYKRSLEKIADLSKQGTGQIDVVEIREKWVLGTFVKY